VNLAVAVGVQQHEIVDVVVATVAALAEVMDVPALRQRQRLLTDQTFPVLL
jgi:hypothetical protein